MWDMGQERGLLGHVHEGAEGTGVAQAQSAASLYSECGCALGDNLNSLKTFQLECLLDLVMFQMRRRDGYNAQLPSLADRMVLLNAYALEQARKFDGKITCGTPTSPNYQDCVNKIICTQFQYAREGFAYAGRAKFDPVFNLSKADFTVPVDKNGKPRDNKQSVKLDPFNYTYGIRVNPSSKSLFRAYVLGTNLTDPILKPFWNERIKQDSSAEDKFVQGDARNPGRALSFIFSPDDRIRIDLTNTYPYSAAVQISFNFGSSGFSCSGALISRDAVLTAGHCVAKKGAWATGLVITPGRNNAASTMALKTPFGTAGVSSMTTYTGWFTEGKFFYDMAVIKLNKPIGNTVGWFGMMRADTFNVNLNAIGYPGDKIPAGSQWYYYCPAVSDSDPSDQVTKNKCDIWPGQSGSGNYIKDSKSDRYIRGITSYHTCTCNTPACTGSGCGEPRANYLQQLTSRRFSDAKAWAGIIP